MLQETHVASSELASMEKLYSQTWGFRLDEGKPFLSFWVPASGVAILVNPYGKVKAANLRYNNCGRLCNCASHQKASREMYFKTLKRFELPATDHVLVGGDFNCTMEISDRCYQPSAANHALPGLESLLATWALVDSIASPDGMPKEIIRAWCRETYMYCNPLPSEDEASARLERWYGSVYLVN
ncbi:hypothetical protein CCR75_007761 [Bremia lactucae]|uniref:Endonuclease/exonuclease/phosphatase domain-containing protein n=1 Tax=Bremia lactucae TaxID=4779 RepID=A0A976II90_BRELC|nr:hypothetical protein CCR75_007761 [Bremia lactucae]